MKHLNEIDYKRPEFGDFYDELPLWSAPFGLRLLDCIPMRAGMTILDVGAGTGFLTLELAQRCGSKTKVFAVDSWHAGMNRLRRKIAHLGLDNVTLLEQDAVDTNLPDESVDVVVSNLGINNFDNVYAVMRTMFRVAKANASLLLTTNLSGHMAEFYDVFRSTLVQLQQSDRLDALENHVGRRGTVDSISEMLRKAGFATANIETDSFRLRFADGTALLRHYFVRLAFTPGWKSIVDADSVQLTFETLEQNLNAVAEQTGELVLTVPMACIEARKQMTDTN